TDEQIGLVRQVIEKLGGAGARKYGSANNWYGAANPFGGGAPLDQGGAGGGKVPVLGDIEVLGPLFQKKAADDRDRNRAELLKSRKEIEDLRVMVDKLEEDLAVLKAQAGDRGREAKKP